MNRQPQRQAQQRVDQIAAFRKELCELEQEQVLVLTTEQRSRLETHINRVLSELARQHGADLTESSRRISWGIRVAALLGGAAMCAAVVLFLHRILGVIPVSAYLPLLASIPLIILGAAEVAFRRGVDLYYTGLLALAAGIAFVMELNGLGSTFNATPSMHALAVWAVFAILVAYAYGLRLLLGAGLLLLCAYTAAFWLAAAGGYWLSFMERAGRMIPAAVILYALPALMSRRDPHDFGFVYRLCGSGTALLGLLILSLVGDPCLSGLPGQTVKLVCQLAGLLLSAGVVIHGLGLGRSGLVNLGAVGFVVFLFVRLHAWWWDWMPKYVFFLLIGTIMTLLLLLFRRMRTRFGERMPV